MVFRGMEGQLRYHDTQQFQRLQSVGAQSRWLASNACYAPTNNLPALGLLHVRAEQRMFVTEPMALYI